MCVRDHVEVHSTKEELHLDICNNCHPFYTGRQKLIDTEGRVSASRSGSARRRPKAARRRPPRTRPRKRRSPGQAHKTVACVYAPASSYFCSSKGRPAGRPFVFPASARCGQADGPHRRCDGRSPARESLPHTASPHPNLPRGARGESRALRRRGVQSRA